MFRTCHLGSWQASRTCRAAAGLRFPISCSDRVDIAMEWVTPDPTDKVVVGKLCRSECGGPMQRMRLVGLGSGCMYGCMVACRLYLCRYGVNGDYTVRPCYP